VQTQLAPVPPPQQPVHVRARASWVDTSKAERRIALLPALADADALPGTRAVLHNWEARRSSTKSVERANVPHWRTRKHTRHAATRPAQLALEKWRGGQG